MLQVLEGCTKLVPDSYKSVTFRQTNSAVEFVALLMRSWYVPFSNFGTYMDFPDRDFLWCVSVHPGKFNYFFLLYYYLNFQACSQNCEKRLLASSCPSAWNNSATTGRILTKFDIWVFLFGWLRVPTCSLTYSQLGTLVYKWLQEVNS